MEVIYVIRRPEEPEHWGWKAVTGIVIALCLAFGGSVVVGFIVLIYKLSNV